MLRAKRQITQKVLELMPDPCSLKEALVTWYFNLREDGGLRLTMKGLKAFESCELASYTCDLKPGTLTMSVLLNLDKKLQWPYFIDSKNKYIKLFGSRDAVLVHLYGDLVKFLDSLTVAETPH